MATEQAFIIVGASLAAAKAAHALRQEGFTGRLVLIGDEAERPLPAAPLSKGYLLGRQDKAKLCVTTRAGGSAAGRHHQKLVSSVRSGTEPC
jgi:3-phenylpropionate/trans-cinnamate dioxygenase ferredoxin reductase subunit